MRILVVAALFVVCSVPVCAQTPASAQASELEAVSIRPNTGGARANGGISGDAGRLRIENLSLRNIIQNAYDVRGYQLVAPDWMSTVYFDLQATVAGPVPGNRIASLLPPVLTERFHLAVHWETRNLPVYKLVVASGGARMRAALRPGGNGVGHDASGSLRLTGVFSMDALAADLSSPLSRPVLDETGLAGLYQITLQCADPRSLADGVTSPEASIFTAVREQLGLKLEATKAPIQVLVVDHADRTPTGNP